MIPISAPEQRSQSGPGDLFDQRCKSGVALQAPSYLRFGTVAADRYALIRSISPGILINSGHLLENLIFMALRRITPDIFYFKSKGGREVDFVVPRRGQDPMLVQVCESMVDPHTRQREFKSLCEAMAELGVHAGTVVTRREEERVRMDAGTVDVVPAWRFLLSLSDTGTVP